MSEAGSAPHGAAPGAARGAALAISVNGEPRTVPAGTTVTDLLALLGSQGGRCAVEVNREIVPRSLHTSRALADGDAIEIVTFVGGG